MIQELNICITQSIEFEIEFLSKEGISPYSSFDIDCDELIKVREPFP